MSDEIENPLFGMTPHEIAVQAGLSLSTAQSALLKSFAGEALDGAELKAWRKMTGTWIAKPRAGGYPELWFTAGRRSGKTSRILACIAVSVSLDPKYEKNGAPGERFGVFVAAPIVEKTTMLMNTIRGLLDRLGVSYQTRDGWLVLADRPVDVRPMVMNAVHAAADSAKAVIVDDMTKGSLVEGSAKHDATFESTVKAMLLSTGGPFVSGSQAWARDGLHYRTCERFWKKTDGDVLVAKGATWEWVPEHTREECMRRAGGDARTFKREYLGEPGHADDQLLDADDIQACVSNGVSQRPRRQGQRYAAAADLAFRHDFSALAIGHVEERRLPDGSAREVAIEDRLLVWKPRRGAGLDAEGTIAEMSAELRRWGITSVAIDQYSFDLAAARFKHAGITAELIKTDVQSQARRAELFLSKLRSRTVMLLDDPDANRELARLRMQLRSNGAVTYAAPATRHDHDDRSDARFALVERLQHARASDPTVKQRLIFDREPGCGMTVRMLDYREKKIGGFVVHEPVAPPRGTPDYDLWCREQIVVHGVIASPEVDAWIVDQIGAGAAPEQVDALLARTRSEWGTAPMDEDADTFIGVVGDFSTIESRLALSPGWKSKF